jgi:hypothetical protein
MNKKYTIDDLVGEKIVVHCNTQDKANQLMQYFEDNGITWDNGNNPTENSNWYTHKEGICYDLVWGLKKLYSGRKDYFLGKHYQIVEFEDIDIPNKEGKYRFIDLVGKRIVIHCDTEEKAIQIIRYFEDNGIVWKKTFKPTEDNNWHIYEKESCYSLAWDWGLENLHYSSRDYFIKKHYRVVKFEDIDINFIGTRN